MTGKLSERHAAQDRRIYRMMYLAIVVFDFSGHRPPFYLTN
jgi:hypothetical protein